MVKFKDFSRPLSFFQVLFKQILFSRQSCIFKYFSSLCEPCSSLVSLFYVCYDSYVSQQFFCHVETGLPGLNQYLAEDKKQYYW